MRQGDYTLMSLTPLTFDAARSLYASTGFCEHTFTSECVPLNCGIKITACKVCAKEMDRCYC